MPVKKKAAFISGISVISLVLLAVILKPHLHSSPHLPEQADLLKMIQSIQANTENINRINEDIAAQMTDIRDLSGTTERIGSGLQTLQAGVGEQDASLAHLDVLSRRQVELSEQLKGLATELQGDLGEVRGTAWRQKSAVAGMNEAGQSLTATAQEIGRINAAIAEDVRRAEQVAGETVRSMP